jgi:hypothetical protein
MTAPVGADPYFQAIEEAFNRRRGAPLLLSPRDWALIDSWQRARIPLRIVLQGIENCFDAFERRAPGARRINSLGYCRQEVLSLFEIYLGLHAGVTDGAREGSSTATPSAARVVSRHLGRLARRVKETMPHASAAHHDALVGALAATAADLRRLRKALAGEPPVPQTLETDLARLDASLLEAARAALGPDELARIEAEAEAALGPARDRMSPSARLTTLRAAAARRVRQRCHLPRLTLFEEPSHTG